MIYMTKIDIFSGFLGAGKTTLIKKLIQEAYTGEKLVLIENEFGKIGIDGGFLQECGIQITEMNSGCICCSLVGDFSKALKKVIEEYAPDRILIEPSGVGKLSDVIRAVQTVVDGESVVLSTFTTVADASKCKMYMRNFGEFYNDQISNASCIVLSHTGKLSDSKISEAISLIRQNNQSAEVVTTDWSKITGQQILEAMERKSTLEDELERLAKETAEQDHENKGEEHHHPHDHDHEEEEDEHHHHHHDHDHEEDECDDPECECHHHHEEEEEEHHHHHHDHDHEEDECDDPECECHHHHEEEEEEHHHHHHADDVFKSWGVETPVKFTEESVREALLQLNDAVSYGIILRAKGIVEGQNGEWIHFDYIPGEIDIRIGSPSVIGRICVIGSGIHKQDLAELFGVSDK
jgi:G3E family GTPase